MVNPSRAGLLVLAAALAVVLAATATTTGGPTFTHAVGVLSPVDGTVFTAGESVSLKWHCRLDELTDMLQAALVGSGRHLRELRTCFVTHLFGTQYPDTRGEVCRHFIEAQQEENSTCWDTNTVIRNYEPAPLTIELQVRLGAQVLVATPVATYQVRLSPGPFLGRFCPEGCQYAPDHGQPVWSHATIRPHYITDCDSWFESTQPVFQCSDAAARRCDTARVGRPVPQFHSLDMFVQARDIWPLYLPSHLQSVPRYTSPWSICCPIPSWEVNPDGSSVSPNDRPIHYLEIGAYEGRSVLWALDHLGRHPASTITIIDCLNFQKVGVDAHYHGARLAHNLCSSGQEHRILLFPYMSDVALPVLLAEAEAERMRSGNASSCTQCYDVIYIDGGHAAIEAMTDAALAWRLLAPGGIMIFDDVHTRIHTGDPTEAYGGVFSFINSLPASSFTHLHGGPVQVLIRKNL